MKESILKSGKGVRDVGGQTIRIPSHGPKLAAEVGKSESSAASISLSFQYTKKCSFYA